MEKVKLSLIRLCKMMNNHVYLKELVFITIISFYFPLQTNLSAQVSEVWDYPIHAGTEEWKNLKSYNEKLNALNIPDSLLLRMNTQDLVTTCLNYPYWILLTSRNNTQDGYNYIRSIFNGFVELESRVNACNELIIRYKELNPDDITFIKTNVEQGKLSYRFIFIESLISQYPILKNSSKEDLIDVLKTALTFYEKKHKVPTKYSSSSLSTTCLILARILVLSNSTINAELMDQNPDIFEFVEKGNIQPKDILNKIVISSSEYLNQIQ